MPSKYFPFDSTFTGVDSNGISQGDRGASSADWAAYVSRMFTDGYFRLLDGQLEPSISATPMSVDIAAGSAMIKGRQYSQDETVTVSLGLSDSQPRIDRIVLRLSTEAADRNILLKVLKGTPAASSVAPELIRTASVYDICLAQIAVGPNAIQIVEDNLTDTRNDEALCGYVKILLDGRFYPDGTLPELLWVYTMYPETLSSGQKAVIEGDSVLMGIYEASNIQQIDAKTIQNKVATGTLSMFFGNGVPDGYIHANGALINFETYADLYAVLGDAYSTDFTASSGKIIKVNNLIFLWSLGHNFTAIDIEGFNVYSTETAITLALAYTNGSYTYTAIKDSLYLIGGETLVSGSGTAVTNCRKAKVMDKNNIASWSTITSLPAARAFSSVVVYNEKYVFCIGGLTPHGNMSQYDNSVQNTVYKAEILSDGTLSVWSTLTALPQALSHASAIILGNKLYVIGGSSGQSSGNPIPITTIRVATINTSDGTIGSWSTYGISLPTYTGPSYAGPTYVFKFMTPDAVYIVHNDKWYSAAITGNDFGAFAEVSGWTTSNPDNNYSGYIDGYLYSYYSSAIQVRKYEAGAFGEPIKLTNATRGQFKLPDFRLGSIAFSNTLVPSVAFTGGGLQNQGRPIISPIPCIKY
ncbi:MAG: tail fiber protein [Eubacteriales bacterium]